MSNRRDLKAYVRYDGSGKVIPGSLILQRKSPKVGDWKEIDAYECCNPTTSTSSTSTSSTSTTIALQTICLNWIPGEEQPVIQIPVTGTGYGPWTGSSGGYNVIVTFTNEDEWNVSINGVLYFETETGSSATTPVEVPLPSWNTASTYPLDPEGVTVQFLNGECVPPPPEEEE
jgi:hypothetical protein